jgi:hypothetical protein
MNGGSFKSGIFQAAGVGGAAPRSGRLAGFFKRDRVEISGSTRRNKNPP